MMVRWDAAAMMAPEALWNFHSGAGIRLWIAKAP